MPPKPWAVCSNNHHANRTADAHSTIKCDSDENCLTGQDDSQNLGQNVRDLSSFDKQANEPLSGSLKDDKLAEVVDKDARKEPQNEQEKPAKPHNTRQPVHLSQENYHKNYGVHEKPQQTKQKSDTINGVSGSLNSQRFSEQNTFKSPKTVTVSNHNTGQEVKVDIATKIGANLPSLPDWLVNGVVGFGDGVAWGMTLGKVELPEIRRKLDIDGGVNTNSKGYKISHGAGAIYGVSVDAATILAPKQLVIGGGDKLQKVSHWTPPHVSTTTLRNGDWVMTGSTKGWSGFWNYRLSGVKSLGYKSESGFEKLVPKKDLSYPPGWEKIKGLMGQRIYTPK
ncbi:MAG: hypothetical protein IJ780_03360, partial [Neisseriaceae bacterium]|nr:hypothetical protein [Neisseriaceae bacterium]